MGVKKVETFIDEDTRLKNFGYAMEVTVFDIFDIPEPEVMIEYTDLVEFMEKVGFQFKKFCFIARKNEKGKTVLCSGIYSDEAHLKRMNWDTTKDDRVVVYWVDTPAERVRFRALQNDMGFLGEVNLDLNNK